MNDWATHTIDLGTLDLGNNHHTGHFIEEAAKVEAFTELSRNVPYADDIAVTYRDKFGNVYADTFAVCDLCDMLKPHLA